MTKLSKTKRDLEEVIRIEARALGAWPRNMSLVIYPVDDCWNVLIGFSDASQTDFRDKLQAMCLRLRENYELVT